MNGAALHLLVTASERGTTAVAYLCEQLGRTAGHRAGLQELLDLEPIVQFVFIDAYRRELTF